MKAKRKRLTAATLSAFLALAGAILAQDTGGDKGANTGKKPGKITHARKGHKGGKKGHKGGKKGHKGGKRGHKGGKKGHKGGKKGHRGRK